MGKGGGDCTRPAMGLASLRQLSALRSEIRPAEATVPGMEAAAEYLREQIDSGATIAVFCDYDLDGTASATLARQALELAGAAESQMLFGYATPSGGYGEMTGFVETAAQAGAGTLLICDCGSSQAGAVARAQQHGMSVIVIDHHQADPDNPADFHLNPGAHNLENHLTAAQLTWKLGAELSQQSRGMVDAGWYTAPLSLAAQGMIADMADLKHPENDAFYRIGLDENDGELPVPPGVRMLAARFGEKLSNPYKLYRTRSALNMPKRTDRVDAARCAALLGARTDAQAAPLVERLVRDYHSAIARRDKMQALMDADWQRRCARDVREPHVAVAVVDGFAGDVGQAGVLAMRLAAGADRSAVVFCEHGTDAAGRPQYKFSARPRRPRKNDPDGYPHVPIGQLISDADLLRACHVARRGPDGEVQDAPLLGGHPDAGVVSGTCLADAVPDVIACFEQLAERTYAQLAAA